MDAGTLPDSISIVYRRAQRKDVVGVRITCRGLFRALPDKAAGDGWFQLDGMGSDMVTEARAIADMLTVVMGGVPIALQRVGG
jgi:hypothetical protein